MAAQLSFSNTVPDSNVKAPPGSAVIVKATPPQIYVNTGTATAPVWSKVTGS